MIVKRKDSPNREFSLVPLKIFQSVDVQPVIG